MPETFIWPLYRSVEGAIDERVLENSFGDGYTQMMQVGINSRSTDWAVQAVGFYGGDPDLTPIKDFLNRHGGAKAFAWSPPGEPEGLYVARDRKVGARHYGKKGTLQTLSWTMKQVFHP